MSKETNKTTDEDIQAEVSAVRYHFNPDASDEPNGDTRAAIDEIKNGGGTLCKTFEGYLKTVKSHF